MRNKYLLLLFFLLTGILHSVAQQKLQFNIASLQQDQYDMTAKKESTAKRDASGSLYAIIKVRTDIPDDDLSAYKFDFGSMNSTQEVHDDELWVYVQKNAKVMTIRRNGYKAIQNKAIATIKEGCTYILSLTVQTPEVRQRILQFKVTPANEGALIKVKKEGAADYQSWGTVDANGTKDRLLDCGYKYYYEVIADNYNTAVGQIQLLNGEDNYVEEVRLVPNFGFLQIDDTYGIAGATIYVDNKKIGTVPYTSTDRWECRDNYKLMIDNGEMYKTYNSTFAIKQGETTKLSPKLESNFAETTIKVESGDADIYINGVRKASSSWTGPLVASTYNVECRKENHVTSKRQITVKPNVAETFTIPAPTPITGSMYVTSTPSGAKIFIDGQDTHYTTPHNFSSLLIGSHKLTLYLANHKTEEKTVEIAQGERKDVTITLSDMARMTIASKPTGATLYIDGKRVGTTPYTHDMASGDYTIKLEKNGCRTYEKKVHLDSSNPNVTLSLSRQYQKKTTGYIQPTFQAGQAMAVGGVAGGYIYNINVEASFLYGLSKTEEIFWNNSAGYEPVSETLKPMYAGGKVGYGFIVGSKFRFTPQVGVGVVLVSGEQSKSNAINVSFGVRAEYIFANHLGVSVAPEYSLAVSKSERFELLSGVSSKLKNFATGFNCRIGVYYYF